MNQKNYKVLFCSLLMASFMSMSPMGVMEDDFDDEGPMRRESTMSPTELEQEKDNHEWAQKYAGMVGMHFFTKGIDRIDLKNLESYLKNNTNVASDSLYADRSYMLGAVNGFLAKYASKKMLNNELLTFSEKQAEILRKNLPLVVYDAKKHGKAIKNWGQLVKYAETLNLPKEDIKAIKDVPGKDQQKLIEGMNSVLLLEYKPTQEIARALDLAFEIEKENNRQGDKKVAQVARSLDLTKEIIRVRKEFTVKALQLAHAIGYKGSLDLVTIERRLAHESELGEIVTTQSKESEIKRWLNQNDNLEEFINNLKTYFTSMENSKAKDYFRKIVRELNLPRNNDEILERSVAYIISVIMDDRELNKKVQEYKKAFEDNNESDSDFDDEDNMDGMKAPQNTPENLLGSREYPMAFKPGDERLTDE
jgi:hypothetical protein